MVDPVVGIVQDKLLVCYIDHDCFRQFLDNKTKCWMINLSKRKRRLWKQVSPPQQSMFLPTSVSFNSEIWIIGGSHRLLPPELYNEMSGTNIIQKFNVDTLTWSRGPDLPAPLFEGCAVATGSGLVVIGWFETGDTNTYIYDRSKSWRPLSHSHYSHTSPGCTLATVNSVTGVMVITGNQVEMLDLDNNVWVKLPQPNIDRASERRPTVGISFGRLMIAGGVDMSNVDVSDVIEEWDDIAHQWVLTSTRVKNPTLRQGQVAIPIKFMDFCDIKE